MTCQECGYDAGFCVCMMARGVGLVPRDYLELEQWAAAWWMTAYAERVRVNPRVAFATKTDNS